MAVVTQIQVRRGTASQWTSTNPQLAAGEFGFETDTNKLKCGNGTTNWNSLAYINNDGDITGVTAGTGISGGGTSGTVTVSIDTSVTADLTTAQTLTNKTFTTPTITQGTSTPSFTTNAYTLVIGDAGKALLASNSSTAGTINVPTNSVAYPVGTQITIIQTGSGQLTVQATSSGTTTILSTGTTAAAPKLRAQYSALTLLKTATETWYAFGDIS
jgi:hypothetical protein